MKNIPAQIFVCFLTAAYGSPSGDRRSMQALVLLDSGRPEVRYGKEMVLPYLDHFGIPYTVLDLASSDVFDKLPDAAVFVVSHSAIAAGKGPKRKSLEKALDRAVRSGAGLVTFDALFLNSDENACQDSVTVSSVRFQCEAHFITSLHAPGDSIRFFGAGRMPVLESGASRVLIEGRERPFLLAESRGQGRVVRWAGPEWMHSSVLGPLAGLDDCLWRSIVWAARKPFVLRGLPPIVTMRVDDVAGWGELWNRSPLYWVETANSHGFKPWLGLFIYNLNPEAVEELRGYLFSAQATASPHALGRPNRRDPEKQMESYLASKNADDFPFYYNPDALPLRADSYDEFIYFNHHLGRSWPNEEAEKGLKAVDDWIDSHQPLPMSTYFVPHWYEFGENVVRHVAQQWGMQFIALPKPMGVPYDESIPWLLGRPFRLHETPQSCRIIRPVYYTDTVTFAGDRFFNCLTEIRDDAGYEWAPDNDVQATIGRGVRQLRRAFDSMALPVLFTHETDYIYRITPENWEAALKGISAGILSYHPVYVTMDEALKTVRATKTSKIESAEWIPSEKSAEIAFTGDADVKTGCYLFTEQEGEIRTELVSVDAFRGAKTVQVKP